MAFAKVETKIQNPARLRKKNGGKRNVARKMSAKQIRFFGTKRQKAALRARRSGHKRHNAATPKNKKMIIINRAHRNPSKRQGGGRVITGYGSTVMNPTRRNRAHKRKRRNPIPEIISLTMGNPARRKNVAATKRKNRATKRNPAAASRRNAGSRRHHKRHHRHHHRRNPAGLGSPTDWLFGGVGVIAGAVGARVLPQLAGSANTGAMGYAMNLGAGLGLGFLSHMVMKNPIITGGVIAGAVAATLVRVISDNTSYGSYLALSGVGDYVVWNFSQPQRVTGQNASMIDTSWRMAAAQAQSAQIAGSIDKFRG